MSKSWMIQGIVREKPRVGILEEYNGEDVYHPNQPKRGQIDEMLMNLSHSDKVIVIGINPGPDDTPEEIAEEFMNTALWGLKKPVSETSVSEETVAKSLAAMVVIKKFIEDNKINCSETVHQCDWVAENSLEFIESLCEIVGYYDIEGD